MTIATNAPTIPTNAAEAIAFVLDYLEPFEAAEFLGEWREGKDLLPWVEAWHQDRQSG